MPVENVATLPGRPHTILEPCLSFRHPEGLPFVLMAAQGLDYPESLKIILTNAPRGGFACLFALSLSLSLLRSH